MHSLQTDMSCRTLHFNRTIWPIEEGRERQVTSYLRQWTQLIRMQGRGSRQYSHIPVLKCGCTDKTISLIS